MKILMPLALIVLAVLAATGWYQYQQEHRRADAAQSTLDAQKRIGDYADNLQAATFLRTDGKTITYGVPTEVTANGQTFVNITEHTARIDSALIVVGPDGKDNPKLLDTLTTGTPIHVLVHGSGSTEVVSAIYLTP